MLTLVETIRHEVQLFQRLLMGFDLTKNRRNPTPFRVEMPSTPQLVKKQTELISTKIVI
jgi:hypothetical protein